MFRIFTRPSFTVLSKFESISCAKKQGAVLRNYVSLGIAKQCLSKKCASWLSICLSLETINSKFSSLGFRIVSIASGKIGDPNNNNFDFEQL